MIEHSSILLFKPLSPCFPTARLYGNAAHSSWDSRDELRIHIVHWIERTYHRCRRQPRLGKLTPIEYENIMNLLS